MNSTTLTTNSTITILTCGLSVWELWVESIIKNAVGVTLSFLLLLLPFTTFLCWLTVIGLFSIQHWRSSARKYYYAMATSNVFANLFGDLIFCGYIAFSYICSLWFNISYPALPNFNLFNLNIVFCRALTFLSDASPTFEYWTTAAFVMHRTLVILFPFHAQQINGFTSYWILIIPTIFTLFYVPSLFLSFLSPLPQNKFYICIVARNIDGFWAVYYATVNAVAMFVTPIIVVILCNILTAIRMTVSSKQRSRITHSEQQSSRGEQRANLLMITISVSYIVGTLPNAILTLINRLLPLSCSTLFIYTILGGPCMLPLFVSLPQIIRFVDSVAFIIMIRELRNSLSRLFCCSRLPFLSLSSVFTSNTRISRSTKESTKEDL